MGQKAGRRFSAVGIHRMYLHRKGKENERAVGENEDDNRGPLAAEDQRRLWFDRRRGEVKV